ncbi:MAG: TetR/AcrR family transcriptional regulator [Anaerolineaceae bacterium]|nr:TetR/AcrR family transcriptional regulator [Anaerolineaceae bacterium]
MPSENDPSVEADKPQKTRERILDAALDVFSRKGYYDTRMDEIVEEASASKGSIYFHFPNKEKLFMALVEKFAALLERNVSEAIAQEPQGMARVQVALQSVLETFGKYRRPAKILLVQAVGLGNVFEKTRMQMTDRFAELIKTYLDEAIEVGEIEPVDTTVVAHAWMGAIYNVVIQWVYTGDPEPQRIMDTLLPLLLNSVQFHVAREDA